MVGGFIIAWLNTAPETIFFLTALETNNPNFAVGAICGSAIVVCTIAIGFCVFIGSKARRSNSITLFPGVQRQAQMLGASLILAALVIVFGFQYYLGILGIFLYMLFVAYTLLNKASSGHSSSSSSSPPILSSSSFMPPSLSLSFSSSPSLINSSTPINLAPSSPSRMGSGTNKLDGTVISIPSEKDVESGNDEKEVEHPLWHGIAYLTVGGALIYMFSEPFINAVVQAGHLMEINPIVLAFFFAPIASEAPEILESISLSRKGKIQNINIAFSNLVGGTISKTTLLCGILCLYGYWRGFEWVSPAYTVSMLMVLVCTGAAASFGFVAEHPRWRGQVLMGLFFFVAIIQYFFASPNYSNVFLG